MKRGVILILLFAATVRAQDTSFSRLAVRASVFRAPVTGHLADDWKPGTGAQIEVASNVSRSNIALAIGHVGFDPTTGKPPFTGTFVSLGWTAPLVRRPVASIEAGARLTDVRMHFDDPAFVAGLRTEEEVMLSVVTRGSVRLGRGFSALAEASYGVLMLSTRTPMAMVAVGVARETAMPAWLIGILR